MGRARRKQRISKTPPAPKEPLVNEFAAQHGTYEKATVVDLDGSLGGKRNSMVKVMMNRGQTVVDRWMAQGGSGFEEPQRRAIGYCRSLWHAAGGPTSLVADLDRVLSAGAGNGFAQHEALTEQSSFKSRIPAEYWSIFENVVRWDEPAGTAGSRFANNPAQSIAAAKSVVGFVASLIAMWCRF